MRWGGKVGRGSGADWRAWVSSAGRCEQWGCRHRSAHTITRTPTTRMLLFAAPWAPDPVCLALLCSYSPCPSLPLSLPPLVPRRSDSQLLDPGRVSESGEYTLGSMASRVASRVTLGPQRGRLQRSQLRAVREAETANVLRQKQLLQVGTGAWVRGVVG